jgi:uncharacterized SAM-binding protein YcdF (DUF218 family)
MRHFFIGVLVGILLSVATGVASFLALGSWLATEDALVKSDAIVAISGDTGARTDTAVALWKDGWAPLIIFSGAAIDPESVSSAEIMRREAVRQGVPESATLIEPNSTTTDENASEVAKLLIDRRIKSAILVTSPWHQRRASIAFSRALASRGVALRNYPARDPQWNAVLWWQREPMRSQTLLELAKLGSVILSGAR